MSLARCRIRHSQPMNRCSTFVERCFDVAILKGTDVSKIKGMARQSVAIAIVVAVVAAYSLQVAAQSTPW